MTRASTHVRWIWWALIGSAIVALWVGTIFASGFSFIEILMFAGPGMVLAVATSWTSHAFVPDSWSWDDAYSAATIGATVFPPMAGVLFAWVSSFRDSLLVILLVMGSWIALGVGLAAGAIRLMLLRRHPERHPAVARVERLG